MAIVEQNISRNTNSCLRILISELFIGSNLFLFLSDILKSLSEYIVDGVIKYFFDIFSDLNICCHSRYTIDHRNKNRSISLQTFFIHTVNEKKLINFIFSLIWVSRISNHAKVIKFRILEKLGFEIFNISSNLSLEKSIFYFYKYSVFHFLRLNTIFE